MGASHSPGGAGAHKRKNGHALPPAITCPAPFPPTTTPAPAPSLPPRAARPRNPPTLEQGTCRDYDAAAAAHRAGPARAQRIFHHQQRHTAAPHALRRRTTTPTTHLQHDWQREREQRAVLRRAAPAQRRALHAEPRHEHALEQPDDRELVPAPAHLAARRARVPARGCIRLSQRRV